MAKTRTTDIKKTIVFKGQTYLPGQDVEVPEDFPELDDAGDPIHPEGSRAAMNQAQSRALAPQRGAAAPVSEDELSGMSKAELEQLAADRGLTVTRTDGSEGEPRKQDYIDALKQQA